MTVTGRAIVALCLAALLAGCTSGSAKATTRASGGSAVATAVQPRSSGPGVGSSGRGSTPGPSPSTPTPTGTPTTGTTGAPHHTGTLHYIVNAENVAQLVPLGYDMFDTGPDTDEL